VRERARGLNLLAPCGRRTTSRDTGFIALEVALVAPALLFLIFLSIQAALFFYGRSVAIQSAREGVVQLRLAQDEAAYRELRPLVVANIERYAATVGRESLRNPVVDPSYDDGEGRVRVEVSGEVISLVPFVDLSVTQSAEGPIERFQIP